MKKSKTTFEEKTKLEEMWYCSHCDEYLDGREVDIPYKETCPECGSDLEVKEIARS